jgi:hypothetical protein
MEYQTKHKQLSTFGGLKFLSRQIINALIEINTHAGWQQFFTKVRLLNYCVFFIEFIFVGVCI